jgi:hypothetical protein
LAELRDHDLNAIVEIDLSRFSKSDWDLSDIEFAVCDETRNIKWLYSDQEEAYLEIYEEREAAATVGWKRHLVELLDRYEIRGFSEQYSVAAMSCWKCGAPTPIFTWTVGMWGMKDSPPPDPKPRTINPTWSGTAEVEYWANRCGTCDSLQGDFYIGLEPQLYEQDWIDRWHKNHDSEGQSALFNNWVKWS